MMRRPRFNRGDFEDEIKDSFFDRKRPN